uniref:Peptidase aspartic putative domain-containing protein n=1 Tax=Anopheles dirus TaxID=7168 RepID=A0A182NPX8_9DIPT
MTWVRHTRYNCGRALSVFADFIDDIMPDASEVAQFNEEKEEKHKSYKRHTQTNVFAHSEVVDSMKTRACWKCKSEQHRYEHLRDLPMQDKCSKIPRMLIGLDQLHLFAPLESRIGQPDEPIGVRTKLGWTIYGPKPEKNSIEYAQLHPSRQILNENLHDAIRESYRIEETGISSAIVA